MSRVCACGRLCVGGLRNEHERELLAVERARERARRSRDATLRRSLAILERVVRQAALARERGSRTPVADAVRFMETRR